MGEAVAAVSPAATIVQLVDFATKVIERLNEFSSDVRQTPLVFRHIQSQLPLILGTLQETQAQASNWYADLHAGDSLKTCVMGCLEEVKQLDGILANIVPPKETSAWKRSQSALKSLSKDKKVQQITKKIDRYIQTLTFSHTTATRLTMDSFMVQQPQGRSAEILRSLPDTGGVQERYKVKDASEDTCKWLQRLPEFKSWILETGSHILNIVGKAGTGKSVLAKHVLKFLEEQFATRDIEVLYYFCSSCNDQDETANSILKGLITQLLHRRPSLIHVVLASKVVESRSFTADQHPWSLEAL